MQLIGIDPGTTQGAFVVWDTDGEVVVAKGIEDNDKLLEMVGMAPVETVACEFLQSFGMAVGKETFETAYWIGQLSERCIQAKKSVFRVYRKDVKMHFCQSMRAKDTNIRQALIDRFGAVGTKKTPGKLYGISNHLWSALAVAVFAGDRLK